MLKQLQIQLTNYKKLYEYVNKQHELLLKLDDGNFQKLTQEIEILIDAIKNQDRTMISLKGMDGGPVKKLQQEIQDIAGQIRKINQTNEVLIQNRINFIGFNINVATQTKADMSYAAGGNETSSGVSKLKMFDQSI